MMHMLGLKRGRLIKMEKKRREKVSSSSVLCFCVEMIYKVEISTYREEGEMIKRN